MKRKVMFILIIILLLPGLVYADTSDTLTEELLEKIELSELEYIMQNSSFYELYGYTDPVTFIYDVISSNDNIDEMSLKDAVINMLIWETKNNLALVIKIFAVGVISVFIGSVTDGYLSKEISFSVNLICVLSIASLVSGVFFSSVKECSDVVSSLSNLLGVCVPAMLMLIAAGGAVSTAGIISPTLTLFCSYSQMIVNNILLPISVIIFVLGITDSISDAVNLKSLCSALKKGATVMLGLSFTVIAGIVSVEGVTFAHADSVGLKAVKYAAGSLIPVVGSFLSGSFDTVLGLVTVIKSAVGLLGMLIIIAIIISPMVKLAIVYLALKITSALVSIFADGTVSGCIERASSALGFVLTLNGAMALMSVMLISMLMNIGISVWG
ncbi:MAG: hypothetical protein E7218_07185 [Anaerofustis stercorihominis]|nr:hypothetical protein [Anaerofustis stercorihominis]